MCIRDSTYCSKRPVVFYDPAGESIKAAIIFFVVRKSVGLIAMIVAWLRGNKQYNNSYDPEDTDPTKPRNLALIHI